MARIFQDSAGTIPVTTFDQPVGKIVRGAGTVDLEQSDPGKRPTMKLFEPDGAEPRWYLYCPAGTGLEAVVDAGEYEIATLDPWGGVAYEVVTSDGSTPITFTRSTMSMDTFFRTPVFSEGEKVAIERYWSKWKIEPEVDDLYMAGQRGVFLDLSDQSTLFQTDDQTTPVTAANDPIGLALDLSGNGIDMVQSVQAARGQYKTDGDVYRVQLDKVDDNYEFDFTGSGGFEATWYQPSKEGLVKGKLLIPDGVWKLAREHPNYFPSNNIMGLIIVEGDVPEAMDKAIFDWWEAKGCASVFAGISMEGALNTRRDITELDIAHWNPFHGSAAGFAANTTNLKKLIGVETKVTSTCVSLNNFTPATPNLEPYDVSQWDVSNVWDFQNACPGGLNAVLIDLRGWTPKDPLGARWDVFCRHMSNLTTVLVSETTFDSPLRNYSGPENSFLDAFRNTNLDQESIDAILVAVEAANNHGNEQDASHSPVFYQSGGSAPSAIGEAAINALRLRNWTVTVTGGY